MPKIYIADVRKEDVPIPAPVPEPVEDKLFRLIRDSDIQQRDRSKMVRHPLLDQAAQRKANDMAAKHYFAHTSPSGVSANQNVRTTGYRLPEWYPLNGNNVESLFIGSDLPEDAAGAWLDSDHHRPHVYAEDNFFRNQNCIGTAYAPFPGEEHRGYWVYLSAPCA